MDRRAAAIVPSFGLQKDKTMRFIIIDDDTDSQRQTRSIITESGGTVVGIYDDVYEASQYVGTIDVIIIDLSAISPLTCGPAQMYGPIASMAEKHPGSEFIIHTAMSRSYVEDVMDMVKARMETPPIYYVTDYCATGEKPDSLESVLKKITPHDSN